MTKVWNAPLDEIDAKTTNTETGAVSGALAQHTVTENGATSAGQDSILTALGWIRDGISKLINAVLYPSYVDRSSNRTRGTVILESGTVTTCSTVTNASTIDTYQGRIVVFGQNLSAWNACVRSRIT